MNVETKNRIVSFSGKYRFLSNFYPVKIEYEGLTFRSVEAAYQGAKSGNREDLVRFSNMEASESKKEGSKLKLRPDWENIKLDLMLELNRRKFYHPELQDLLLATGNAELIEGNYWGDRFWGESPLGKGKNHLGKILMKIRAEIDAAMSGSFI